MSGKSLKLFRKSTRRVFGNPPTFLAKNPQNQFSRHSVSHLRRERYSEQGEMDFPPEKEDWAMFGADAFEAAEVRDAGPIGMELMCQARNNGHIQDHFRIALGGGAILNVNVPFKKLFNSDRYNHLSLLHQVWPRDIVIGRNSATSEWMDVTSLIREREATIRNEADETIPQEEVIAGLEEEQDPAKKGASIRWMIVVGDDKKMWLELAALPAGETTISGKPTLKR